VPVLVVGTTHDPATPYAQAESLARQLDAGRLLTLDGDGHTAYLRGVECVDAAVHAYLLDPATAVDGTRC
jgi:pimeloyl-ACP methyl ester carboxylesterase